LDALVQEIIQGGERSLSSPLTEVTEVLPDVVDMTGLDSDDE
jgi:hypothetical protein